VGRQVLWYISACYGNICCISFLPQLAQSLEAARLANASFGETMLHCIGRVYRSQADMYLGGAWDGTWARVKHSTDVVRSAGTDGVRVHPLHREGN
jgi:hypothetical protein